MRVRKILYLVLLLAGLTIVLGKNTCKDRFRGCQSYPKKFCDEDSGHHKFMWKNCQDFCGFCNCKNWKYGCCKDRKTRADGFDYKGCSQKLCYDVKPNSCKEYKRDGACERHKEVAEIMCPWSCGKCKNPAPAKACHDIGYGCCWDGTTALGSGGRGCRPCRDFSKHVCKQFRVFPVCTNTGAYFTRWFLTNHCPQTCGTCPRRCVDRDTRCRRYLSSGYCEVYEWRQYLRDKCPKTCGFCRDRSRGNENALP